MILIFKMLYQVVVIMVVSVGFIHASDPVALTPDGQLYLMNGERDSDSAEVHITGNGENCTVYMNSIGLVDKTDCQRLVNSNKIKILCTKNKKICKSEKEIHNALKGEIKGEDIRMPGLYEVTAKKLNIRNKPKKTSNILGTVKHGERVNIYEFIAKWGRSDQGWISGKYLKYISDFDTRMNNRTPELYETDDTVVTNSKQSEDKPLAWYEYVFWTYIIIVDISLILVFYSMRKVEKRMEDSSQVVNQWISHLGCFMQDSWLLYFMCQFGYFVMPFH